MRSVVLLLSLLASEQDRSLVIKNVRIESPGSPAVDAGLVYIRDGVIRAAGTDVPAPFDARVLDGSGLTLVPAFIDACSVAFSAERAKKEEARSRSVDEGVRILMDPDARVGRTPEYRAELALPFADAKKWREAGFGAFLAVPQGTGIRGQSAAALLIEDGATAARATLFPDVMLHVDLRVSGSGGSGYPSTLMGTLAAYRQFFADAAHHAALWERFARVGGERPPVDPSLRELTMERLSVMGLALAANSAREIRTALALAKELHLRPVITGGAESDKVIAELKEAGASVLLALDFPQSEEEGGGAAFEPGEHDHDLAGHDADFDCCSGAEATQDPAPAPAQRSSDQAPSPATPDAPDTKKEGEKAGEKKGDEKKKSELPKKALAEREERRKERIATASRLAAEGIPFALTAQGLKSPADFRKNLKLAIDAGLPRDAALAALTSVSAEMLFVGNSLGTVESGKLAVLALFDGDPLDPASSVRHLVIGRERFEFDAKPKQERGKGEKPAAAAEIDLTGAWSVSVELGGGAREYQLDMDQKDGKLAGTAQANAGPGEIAGGSITGDSIEFRTVFQFGDRQYEFSYSGKVSGDTMSGTVSINGGEGYPWTAQKKGKPQGGSR